MEKCNCKRCNTEIDAVDNYCRCCGLRLLPGGGEAVAASVVPESKSFGAMLLDNPWFILFMLFFVLGPLALPMLWRGHAFSKQWKWIWTILVVLYTLFALWFLWHMVVIMIVEPFQKLNSEVFHR
jgi:hypothetical protein